MSFMTKILCWFGIHRGWKLKFQYMGDAHIISIFGFHVFKDCIHFVDECPHCGAWWKSVLSPKDNTRNFTERGKGPIPQVPPNYD